VSAVTPDSLRALSIGGCYEIQALVHTDARGSFAKMFEAPRFAELGLARDSAEVFYTVSHVNVLRGMHLQLPPAEHSKFLYCVSGSILDVVLDVRTGGDYGNHCSLELSAARGNGVYLAPGVAHGFYVLEAPAVVVYHTTSAHVPSLDAGIRWDSFGMKWPCRNPTLSERDMLLPEFADFVSPFAASAPQRR
jgi:dTDP-4-dehydrorhamnose 3,5-epimerase